VVGGFLSHIKGLWWAVPTRHFLWLGRR
jgi:hypothetical protein